jgi:S1-C subfamily serine protease
MRIFTYSLAALVIGASIVSAQPALVLKQQAERVAVIEKVKPTVVAVFARGGQGGGTGVLISDDGFALTNFHVVQPTGPTMQCGLADGVLYDGVLVGWDKVGDVALIKLLPKKAGAKFPFAKMGDSDKVKQGDWSIAMGNPFLLATDFTPTVTFGLVSGVNRYQPPAGIILEYTDCIQIDTSINPGNSGGPLFNMQGDVIGINGRGSFDKRGRVNSGVGYAISINQIKNFMGHLHAGLDADHASLGALVRTETENNGIGKTKITTTPLEESDAFRRGLDQEDEIFSFAGRIISSDNHYKNVVGLFPRGWRVPLEYRRGDAAPKEVLVRLMGVQRKELPDNNAPKDQPDPKQPQPKGKGAPGPQGPGAKLYEAKAGFANYYFNKEEKKRILAAFKKNGDFSADKGMWTIDGTVKLLKANTGSPFTMEIDDQDKGKVTLKIGAFPEELVPLDANSPQDSRRPAQSGGFMAAMFVWRTLLNQGDKGFPTECIAGGMEPFYPPPTDNSKPKNWMDQRVNAEVLNTRLGIYQTKWFFSQSDDKLLGLELRLQEYNEDPCEIYFSDYKAVDGRQLPHRMQVYYRDVHYGTFTVTGYKLAAK